VTKYIDSTKHFDNLSTTTYVMSIYSEELYYVMEYIYSTKHFDNLSTTTYVTSIW
jgi:hypothetical protein